MRNVERNIWKMEFRLPFLSDWRPANGNTSFFFLVFQFQSAHSSFPIRGTAGDCTHPVYYSWVIFVHTYKELVKLQVNYLQYLHQDCFFNVLYAKTTWADVNTSMFYNICVLFVCWSVRLSGGECVCMCLRCNGDSTDNLFKAIKRSAFFLSFFLVVVLVVIISRSLRSCWLIREGDQHPNCSTSFDIFQVMWLALLHQRLF